MSMIVAMAAILAGAIVLMAVGGLNDYREFDDVDRRRFGKQD